MCGKGAEIILDRVNFVIILTAVMFDSLLALAKISRLCVASVVFLFSVFTSCVLISEIVMT